MAAHYQYTRVLCSDFAATFAFYRDAMGFTPVFGTGHDTYADFDAGAEVHISLFDRAEMSAAIGTAGLPNSVPAQDGLCLVFEVADVHAAAARLAGLGVAVVTPPTAHPDWGITTLHVRDPEGTLIELNQPLAG